MSSEVDIVNLALSHLGDDATVSSIDPPEGSVQAEHAARYYPIARNSLLEMHSWGFATRRQALALIGSDYPEWDYCYALPTDAVNILSVLPSDATDDYTYTITTGFNFMGTINSSVGTIAPKDFDVEILADGTQVLYTDQSDALLRYTALVTDTTTFSPLFIEALSWLLASKLAGPIIKGAEGRKAASDTYRMFQEVLARATSSDANQRQIHMSNVTSWMVNR